MGSKRRVTMFARPTEQSVGITHFLTEKPQIHALLKHRFSDFVVQEVDKALRVVGLKSVSVDNHLKFPSTECQDADIATRFTNAESSLSSLLGTNQFEELRRVMCGAVDAGDREGASFVLPRDDDKVHRTEVHKAIKQFLPFLETGTAETTDGGKAVQIQFQLKGQGKKRVKSDSHGGAKHQKVEDSRYKRISFHQNTWPSNVPPFLHFTLAKENVETHGAINRVSKLLRVNAKSFGMCGTKDKRAVTFQRVSVHRVTADRLSHLNSILPPSIRMGDFSYEADRLKLGDLSGNRFTIVLRNLNGNLEHLEEKIQNWKTNGFINYFGMQRFGYSAQIPTHAVGIQLFRGDYGAAASLILQPREGDPTVAATALVQFEKDHNFESALAMLPFSMVAERSIIRSYQQNGLNAHQNAIMAIPRNLRTMYMHAFQSFVFNCLTSQRLAIHGPKVVVGDLVVVPNDPETSSSGVVPTETPTEVEEDSMVGEDVDEYRNKSVRLISNEEEAALYALTDVVMPIPGCRVIYPQHSVGKEQYQQLMREHGVDLEKIEAKMSGDFAVMGGYRSIVCVPTEVNWKTIQHSTLDEDLIVNDLDRTNGKPLPADGSDVMAVESGALTSLRVQFTLSSSCYATMCLRELVVIDDPERERKVDSGVTDEEQADGANPE
eukprot:c2926_g1_i1.p1 GENE.c2926_g1_i1~~c2926_g1_i1.p1  ORF type:complete len:663 (-),score=161.11 c2926_g1_i1:20-2008(-)